MSLSPERLESVQVASPEDLQKTIQMGMDRRHDWATQRRKQKKKEQIAPSVHVFSRFELLFHAFP